LYSERQGRKYVELADQMRIREFRWIENTGKNNYICYMKNLSFWITERLKSAVKPAAISAVIIVVLFFLFDDVLMPYYVQKGKTTHVPNVVGMFLAEAKKTLLDAGLQPKEAEFKPDKYSKAGTVVLQNPVAGSEVKYGRGVYLTISGGQEYIEIPNLRGKSLREAEFNLEQYGLRLGKTTYEPSEEMFENTIIRQDPPAGVKTKSGVIIDVVVSQGKSTDKHVIPNIVLKTYTEAEKTLIAEGFQVGKVTYQINLDLLPNTVLEQSPKAGELGQTGQAIDLIVAQNGDQKP
jgi:beta-lactam-binding protein with PASTA domain